MPSPAIDSALRASLHAARGVHVDLCRGTATLASITRTAPFIGVAGTLLGIVNSFPGFGIDRWTAFFVITDRLSQSLVPTGFGLVVALVAWWSRTYLLTQVEAFDVEMDGASRQMMNDLTRFDT